MIGSARWSTASLLAASVVGVHAARAQGTRFVVVRGADTVAIERYARTADRVQGELTLGAAGVRQTYELTLGAGETVTRIAGALYRVGADATPLQEYAATFGADGATLRGGAQEVRHPAPAGSLPFVNLSAAILEQIVRRARALGGASAEVPVVVLAGAQNATATVRWLGADSAVVTLGVELRVGLARDGTLLGAEVPAQGVRFVRAASPAR